MRPAGRDRRRSSTALALAQRGGAQGGGQRARRAGEPRGARRRCSARPRDGSGPRGAAHLRRLAGALTDAHAADRDVTPGLRDPQRPHRGARGLHYDAEHATMLRATRWRRARQDAGFDSLLDYYYFLRYDAAGATRAGRAVEALVVSETYFFRELEPLEVAGRASCSARAWPRAGGRASGRPPARPARSRSRSRCCSPARASSAQVEIVASDISARALERARARRVRAAARCARSVPAFAAAPGSTVGERGVARARRADRRRSRWQQRQPARRRAVAGAGHVRRHPLPQRAHLLQRRDGRARSSIALAGALQPGGALLVGVSESLLRFGTALACEEQGGVFFYTKGADDSR